jgi:YD repeat-containing protein
MRGPMILETFDYNSRGQMTRQKYGIWSPYIWDYIWEVNLEYRFSATQNDGRLSQRKDWVTGEEVNYTYDVLGRLTRAETTSSSCD